MVSLLTNTPEYFADLCDEIRLFFDVRRIPAAQQVGGQGFFVVHAMQKGETFRLTRRCTATGRSWPKRL